MPLSPNFPPFNDGHLVPLHSEFDRLRSAQETTKAPK